MVPVYSASDGATARLICGLLAEAGIDASVEGEFLGGGLGELGLAGARARVLVNEADFETARQLILKTRIERPPALCPYCGYILHGLPEPRCPECGNQFFRPAAVEEWTCGCGEKIEGQFTSCWNCGTERPATSN